ncbi:hypothetical protein [Parageobacillus thermoglucosidasius]|uniref:hypothetical protein n=1 Tax=Parageobacillus thermoglucosidasius TaxID=1426 RepID=UPI00025B5CFC|nr:hypothetical protein [Parageobacillus thermoglucosidasius]EID44534.1 hypothetical protein GT20_1529 [Parageobacillus thermoglucosidasius TNO-09.020]KYD18147.1 hypothetical protein B4168_0113 [Anoxybacillus flavithermus]OAO88964.1 hypothetical protein GT23_0204 [Parageobacillus thermoglucosidasius]
MDEAGKLKAVLLRYYNSYVPHVQDGFAVEGFAALIQQTSTPPLTLSGKTAIVRRFEQWLPLGKSAQCRYWSIIIRKKRLGFLSGHGRMKKREGLLANGK